MKYILLFILFLFVLDLKAQHEIATDQNEIFWGLSGPHAIVWETKQETRLPHRDNIEMSGRKVAAIIHYEVDKDKKVRIERDVIFPQLRTFIGINDPDWMNYRAYLRKVYTDDVLPVITIDDREYLPGAVDSVVINGKLNFYHQAQKGLQLKRTLLPSMIDRMFVEKWAITNTSDSVRQLSFGNIHSIQSEKGVHGTYTREVFHDADDTVTLRPSEVYDFAIYFTARLNDEKESRLSWREVESERDSFLDTMKNNLVMNSPDPVLNTLFYFSKIRAAESIYDSKMGLVHSPGGGRYYTGVWANDQAEYSGPFFPY